MSPDQDPVPEEARRLHAEAREAGGRGDYRRALALLDRANELAPGWPYPVYDAAYTHLLQGDTAWAEELYAEVDRLEPRGFFTCKTTLDMLRRERTGELPAGFSQAFLMLEWADEPGKRAALEHIVARYPGFAPAWKELAALLEDPAGQLRALENGLAASPDPETWGMLLLNKAAIIGQRGDEDEARRILTELTLDPAATLTAQTWARNLLQR